MTPADTDRVTLAQVYQLLREEHSWSEERFSRLEGQFAAGVQGIQAALADVHVQIAALRCDEHRAEVETLRQQMQRRQWLWGGTGFAGGIGAAVAAVTALLKGSN